MSKSYTPGLKVLKDTNISKERLLPLKGNVHVKKNDIVNSDTIIASTEIPGNVRMINIVNELNIDVNQSFIIGDRTVDVMTGINAHISTILLNQGYKGEDNKFNCTSQFVFNDLLEAVKFIIHREDYNQELNFK